MSDIRTQADNDTFVLTIRRKIIRKIMNEDCFSNDERKRSEVALEACQDAELLDQWRRQIAQTKARRQSQNITFPKVPIREVYEDEPINIHSRFRLKTQYAEQNSLQAYEADGMPYSELANL
jgi:hypothetical protein